MDHTYWQKQTKASPLFPELEWSRPENKLHAGKLLVVGGNKYGFTAPATAYNEAEKAGAGLTRVLLPMTVKPVLTRLYGPVLEIEFAASNPSGSFSQSALSSWLDLASWSDGTLVAGDLGRNSETAIILEKFLNKHPGQVTLTRDAADISLGITDALKRPNTLFVVTMAELQKLNILTNSAQAVTFGMDMIHLVELLHWITSHYPISIIVKHYSNIVVSTNGQVSTTKLDDDPETWRIKYATQASVWWLQNPDKPFEALTSSARY